MSDNIIIAQEPVPPATEVDCIEVNKVFDECLVKRCTPGITVPTTLVVADTTIVDATCSGFAINAATSVAPPIPVPNEPGFYKFTVNLVADFTVNVTVLGTTIPVPFAGTLTQTISNVKLYCPEPVASIWTNQNGTLTNETIKLEFVGECVDINFTPSTAAPTLLDANVTLGYYLVIKCEQLVQIYVLSRGYCIAPECPANADPCEEFLQKPVPAFFPVQKVM